MEPQCPTCSLTMVEGFIPDANLATTLVSAWVEGKPEFTALGNAKLSGHQTYAVKAFRCPNCGLLRLYAGKPRIET